MKSRLQRRICIIAGTVLFALQSNAQTVSISGAVKSREGAAVSGAVVQLTGAGLSTTTQNDGNYSISHSQNPVRWIGGAGTAYNAKPWIHKGDVCFHVKENATQVRIELFDLLGRKAGVVADVRLKRGNYAVAPAMDALRGGLYFVAVSVGGARTVLRMAPLASAKPRLHAAPDVNTDITLEKKERVRDTLKVSAAGFRTTARLISSYTGINNFTMENDTAFPRYGTGAERPYSVDRPKVAARNSEKAPLAKTPSAIKHLHDSSAWVSR